ncbi:MAG: galactosyldiacylglycerol synthase [Phototrophicales bacterium]|nr:MAG: galactosyldiacylglycerol synthase [Phototrophicales bacterium]RMG70554.1 MAG: glycosyltransferase [Chloroflexota bacterium]
MVKRIVFLMSDTGGGHRAAAEAITEALYLQYGHDAVTVSLVDVYRQMKYPMNKMPEFYPWIVNHAPWAWGLGYFIGNIKPICWLSQRLMYLNNRKRLQQMAKDHPADVVVSVHSVITQPSMMAYRAVFSPDDMPPFLIVVTDLASTPRYWYDSRADHCYVPTQAAYDNGIRNGMRPNQMTITGLPVHPRFMDVQASKTELRQAFGWDVNLPTVLMVAGGDGMGPLYETARAIDAIDTPCQLVVIAGKNDNLKQRLQQTDWRHPVHVYGFVQDMPQKMKAVDILVTKAGPATITEAGIMGLPMILSDSIPGQEAGNVTHVEVNNAGVFIRNNPALVAKTLQNWLSDDGQTLQQLQQNACKLSNPNAVWEIADAIWQYANR